MQLMKQETTFRSTK